MQRPPRAVADVLPQQAGDRQREQQVERQRAEAEPHGAVRREERNECVLDADRRVPVGDRGTDVDADEDECEQRQVAVERGDREPGPAIAPPAARRQDAEQRRRGEQEKRDHSRSAGQVPERRPGAHGTASVGHPLTVDTVPSTAASLAGSFASASQSTPALPSTIAAVLAAFASTHVGAATRDRVPARRRGPPRARVDDVMQLTAGARPATHAGSGARQAPGGDRDDRPGTVQRAGVVVRDPQGPASRWGVTGDGDVAAQADQHPASGRHYGRPRRAIGGQRLRGRAEIELDARRNADHAAIRVELDRSPTGDGLKARPEASPRRGAAPPRTCGHSRRRGGWPRRSDRRARPCAPRPRWRPPPRGRAAGRPRPARRRACSARSARSPAGSGCRRRRTPSALPPECGEPREARPGPRSRRQRSCRERKKPPTRSRSARHGDGRRRALRGGLDGRHLRRRRGHVQRRRGRGGGHRYLRDGRAGRGPAGGGRRRGLAARCRAAHVGRQRACGRDRRREQQTGRAPDPPVGGVARAHSPAVV